MAEQVALPIAVDVEATDRPGTLDRVLPDARAHGPPLPLYVARHADVDRQQTTRLARHSYGLAHRFGWASAAVLPKLVAMTDPRSPARALRASDAERERAADLLREAMTSGRLSVEELDDRMRQVLGAQNRAELEHLVDDVIAPTNDPHPLGGAIAGSGAARVAVGADGPSTHRILSILGSSERKGRWRLGASCSVLSVLGASELDLRAVELAADHVELSVISVLGSAELTLPPGLNVQISELAVLGSNDVDIGDEQPDPGGPVVHLRLVSVLGSVEVRRGPNVAPDQRKELERRQSELEPGP